MRLRDYIAVDSCLSGCGRSRDRISRSCRTLRKSLDVGANSLECEQALGPLRVVSFSQREAGLTKVEQLTERPVKRRLLLTIMADNDINFRAIDILNELKCQFEWLSPSVGHAAHQDSVYCWS